jgi:hypothetical protein
MEMLKVREIYKHNIYGVIATLSFHVVLLIVLITSDLKYGNQPPGEAVLVDFSLREFIMPDPETNKEPDAKSGTEQQLTSTSGQQASNQAVNEASRLSSRTNDPFFDKAYINEVAAAKKLVSDVNKTLAKNIPEIGDIRMPEENSEGKTREEAKQSNFKGKSNIHYFLENRYHQRLPIPVYLAEGGAAGRCWVQIRVIILRSPILRSLPTPNRRQRKPGSMKICQLLKNRQAQLPTDLWPNNHQPKPAGNIMGKSPEHPLPI